MTGWRIGFAMGPAELIAKASALQSQTTSGAAAPSQYAAAGVLGAPGREMIVREFRDVLDRRRKAAVEGLRQVPGLAVSEPWGAIYLYLRLTYTRDSAAVANSLLQDEGVACVPGEAFGTPGFLRMNYSVDDEQLTEGIGRIASYVADRSGA
jgi:aspartate/methionine/tyrosine aminotransferase